MHIDILERQNSLDCSHFLSKVSSDDLIALRKNNWRGTLNIRVQDMRIELCKKKTHKNK